MSVIQITFDPSLWTAGSGIAGTPGSNGYNAYSVYTDLDGVTGWAFEYFGAGFARFNLTTGAIVHQGAMHGTPGFTDYWYNCEDGTAFWCQDDSGHYYAIPNVGSDSVHLNKFTIGAGTAGNLLDGYCTNPTTFDITTMTPAPLSYGMEHMQLFKSGGVNYIVIAGRPASQIRTLWVINADTMTFVGSYASTTYGSPAGSFMDGSGNIWGVFQLTDHSTNLVKWAGTVTGTNLDVTVTNISAATLGFPFGAEFVAYIGSNSIFLGTAGISWTGPCAIVELATFTVTASHADNNIFFYNGTFDITNSAMTEGKLGCGLMIPATVASPVDNSSLGGILNYVKVADLTSYATLDATAAVLGAGYLAGGTFTDFHTGLHPYSPMGMMAYSYANSVVAMSFEFIGSAVYLVPFADSCPVPPPPPKYGIALQQVLSVLGQASRGAQVAILEGTLAEVDITTQPGSPLAVVYNDPTNKVVVVNPCTTDGLGNLVNSLVGNIGVTLVEGKYYVLQIYGGLPPVNLVIPIYVGIT